MPGQQEPADAQRWAVEVSPAGRRETFPAGTFVIVPAFNEQEVIEGVVRDLLRFSVLVVVIDDGSTDDTAKVARDAGAVVVSHLLNRGQGAAIQTGLEFCLSDGAQIIVTFDADGQHRAEDVARLVEPIVQGRADVVLGSRFLGSAESITLVRKVVLKIGVYLTRLLSGTRLTDVHNGVRAFSASAASRIRLTQDRMAHASQIIDQIVAERLRFQEIPVEIRYTEYSTGKGQGTGGAVRVAFDYLLGRVAK